MSVHRNPRRRKSSAGLSSTFREPVAFRGLADQHRIDDASTYRKPANPPRFRLTEDGPREVLRTIPQL